MTPLNDVLPALPAKTRREFGPATKHYPLFRIGPLSVSYIPLVGKGEAGVDEFGPDDVDTRVEQELYTLPEELATLQPRAIAAHHAANALPQTVSAHPMADTDKGRLCHLQRRTYPKDPNRTQLSVEIQRLKYFDYMAANEFLDTSLGDDTIRTRFTTRFQPHEQPHIDLARLELSNIIGVGALLITADNKLVISKRSSVVAVYPNVVGFTTSGTCDWSDFEPSRARAGLFHTVRREAFEELGQQVLIEDFKLFAVGIDVEQFYFQFSFIHRTRMSVDQMDELHATAVDRAEQSLFWVDLGRPQDVVELLSTKEIEPAAEAALLLLLMKSLGAESVIKLISRYYGETNLPQRTVHRDLADYVE